MLTHSQSSCFFFTTIGNCTLPKEECSTQRTSILPISHHREITVVIHQFATHTKKYSPYCILQGDVTISVHQFSSYTKYLPILKLQGDYITADDLCSSNRIMYGI